MDQPTRAESTPALSYRCVCGESFEIEVGDVDARCPACNRHYAPEAFRAAQAETLTIGHEDAVQLRVDGQPERKVDDARIGQRLDHFHIIELLGSGGMGAVYKALDESLQRYVALKVVRSSGGSSGGGTRGDKIVEEARAQARVSHPNVVHIYYVGRDDASPFFAMELVSGPPLSDVMEQGPLPFAEVINVALQVVDALDQSAAFDIVHGDIKPSNILIAGKEKSGRTLVKLSDFGLAQRVSKSDEHSGSIVGTPDYLSPEAALGEPLVKQSDIYSLGVTLFQLTFGRLPYARDTSSLVEKLEQHTSSAVEFPEPWPVRVPEPWRDVLEKMMAKRAEDRFGSYAELRKAIEQLQPVSLPEAGRLPRLMAWLVDLALLLAIYVVTFGFLHALVTTYEFQTGSQRLSGLHFLIGLSSMLVPVAGMALQTFWGTTPGKAMFQLRIVTPYGHAPPRRTLAVRSLFQFLPEWIALAGGIVATIAPPIAFYLVGSGYVFLALDAAMALFHPTGRSMHDWILHTRVVVQGAPAAKPEADPK